uniref:Uncharacterized protein n=1 Tax=Rhizophagus irregularis (strain DAOM 181602 / DAOM 197198 / MUCL 43194) TaxID=747089 RepID=U9T327_RHIID
MGTPRAPSTTLNNEAIDNQEKTKGIINNNKVEMKENKALSKWSLEPFLRASAYSIPEVFKLLDEIVNLLIKVNLKIEGQRCCVIAYSSYVQYLCQLDLHEFSL